MTPEQKQQKLREWLPEIARACGLEAAKWRNEDEDYAEGCYYWAGAEETLFDPEHDDRDSALVRRTLGIDVDWHARGVRAWASRKDFFYAYEYHGGTPDSMGEAERWAVLQAAAKKLGLE